MNTLTRERAKLHPVIWTAAISVSIASLVAVAAMTGILPKSQASTAPVAEASVPAVASSPATQTTITASTQTEGAKPAHHKSARKAGAQPARYDADAYATAQGYPEPVRLAQADAPAATPPVCNDCGIVEAVRQVMKEGQGSGVGAVAGGVLGGALGNGVGQGNGRTLATIAGIVGGAFAGNKAEKTIHQTAHYEIMVRFDDGRSRVFTQDYAPRWREGDHVKLNNGELTSAA